MKVLAIAALFAGAVSGLASSHLIPGAHVIPVKETAALRKVGAHGQKYPDRRTVTIRPSKNEKDDVSADFLWGIKQANHGGRLVLQKGKTYMIGKKLDLTFLDNVEVQLDGELKVIKTPEQYAAKLGTDC
jgi:galacturan 1,4-alpha-galacturonidase